MSVTVRMNPQIKAAIAAIDAEAWTTIEYTDAVFDEASRRWVSRAEVAEIEFTAFVGQKQSERVPGRLVVRRIPDFNADSTPSGPRRTVRRVAVPRVLHHRRPDDPRHHRRGQDPPRSRDHRAGPRRPEELRPGAPALGAFTANAAWLVLAVMAFNLTRVAGTLAEPQFAKATTATIRRKLITVPARVATSARRVSLHLPHAWPWETAWTRTLRPSRPANSHRGLTTQPSSTARPRDMERPGSEARRYPCSSTPNRPEPQQPSTVSSHRWIRVKPL